MTAPQASETLPGPLDGMSVVELASEHAAWAGKLLAELGADVVVVEPPGGHASRTYGPFLDDEPGPERSLFWWNYNTSKRSVVLDLANHDDATRFRDLAAAADIVLEGEPTGRLAELGLDHEQLRADHPELIWVAVTPFGRATSRTTRPPTSHSSRAAARSGTAGTTITPSRRCAAAGTRPSTSPACSPR